MVYPDIHVVNEGREVPPLSCPSLTHQCQWLRFGLCNCRPLTCTKSYTTHSSEVKTQKSIIGHLYNSGGQHGYKHSLTRGEFFKGKTLEITKIKAISLPHLRPQRLPLQLRQATPVWRAKLHGPAHLPAGSRVMSVGPWAGDGKDRRTASPLTLPTLLQNVFM